MSLTDPVAQGDYLTAYSYADLTAWSDMYAYFNVNTAQAAARGGDHPGSFRQRL